jgi:hypothetical protein
MAGKITDLNIVCGCGKKLNVKNVKEGKTKVTCTDCDSTYTFQLVVGWEDE